MKKNNSKKERLSYYLFDWANSPFSTIVITFIISSYFVNKIAPDNILGTSLWGWTIAASSFFIAILGPLLGFVADKRKNFSYYIVLFLTLFIVFLCTMLWFSKPSINYLWFTLIIIFFANTFFEISQIFYNSFLPQFKKNFPIGEFSGTAWAYGYIGGIVCLCLILFLLVLPSQNIFGLDEDNYEHIRVTGPIVALWYLLFSLPFLANCNKFRKHFKTNQNQENFISGITKIFKNKSKFKYLLARMVYTDGLITLFSFGGIYASTTFGFSFNEIIVFGITINISAAIGAYVLGIIENRIGSKQVILISLIFLIVICFFILFIKSKVLFWALSFFMGFFIGSIQSSSRTTLVNISNKTELNKMFGLYAFSGKSTNFLGPLLVASLTSAFDSQRVGMSVILAFLILGSFLLYKTKV